MSEQSDLQRRLREVETRIAELDEICRRFQAMRGPIGAREESERMSLRRERERILRALADDQSGISPIA